LAKLQMDLTDPENWKLSAELIGYWKEIAGGVVVIAGAVGTLLRWGFTPFHLLWSKIKRRENRKKVASICFVLPP
jgi:hypothetical protein